MSLIKTATNSIGVKIIMVFALGFLLLIPMNFIDSVVRDRKGYQADAIDSIIEPIGGNLQLNGILAVIPYTVKVVDKDDKESYIVNYIYISPETYDMQGDVKMKTLKRGIFTAPVFTSELKVKGNFESYKPENYSDILWDSAFLVVGSKKKNFTSLPDIQINGVSLEEHESSTPFHLSIFTGMFVFKLPQEYAQNGFAFDAIFEVQGGDSIAIRPLKSENRFTLSSKWSDPSFSGGWIPTERSVTDDGFTALWDIPGFHTSLDKVWTSQTDTGYKAKRDDYSDSRNYTQSSLDYHYDNGDFIITSFLLLNDNYQKTTRSTKYAILFIFIPFFALLLCELLSKKMLHIIQYCLIGFANVIFFLLLLSISEHLSFNISYLLGAIMVTSVVSLYVSFIMRSKKLGFTIAVVQAVAYIFLFVMLQLTDYSLLVGSLGLFTVIALGMYLTRNIDWFNPASSKGE